MHASAPVDTTTTNMKAVETQQWLESMEYVSNMLGGGQYFIDKIGGVIIL